MTEAEAVQPDPPPTPEPASSGITLDWDALDAGDLEDMEDYCGRPVLGLLNEALAQIPEGTPAIAGLMAALPAKVITALLGVAKRHQDPMFGPDRWRSIKLSELGGGEAAVDPFEGDEATEEAPAATPIRPSTGKRGSAAVRPTGSARTSKPG